MQPSSKRLLTVAIVLALGVAAFILVQAPAVPDDQQIRNQVEALREAGEHKSTSGVMRLVSEHYHDALMSNPEQLSFLLSRHLFKSDEPVQVQTRDTTVTITGETATSVTNITVSRGGASVYTGNITLQWKKEESSRLLVIPDHIWRIVSAEYPANPDMME